MPPPTEPGIHDRNSNPLKWFLRAKLDKLLSDTALPAIIISLPCNVILLKFLPNLITTPSNKSSVTKIFEPAPRINILSRLLRILSKVISSSK